MTTVAQQLQTEIYGCVMRCVDLVMMRKDVQCLTRSELDATVQHAAANLAMSYALLLEDALPNISEP